MVGILISTNPLLNMPLTARVTFEIFKKPHVPHSSLVTPNVSCHIALL